MPNLSKKSITWGVLLIALTIAGCHKLMGGGWFYGLGGEKVNFAFNAQCYENDEALIDPYSLPYNTVFYKGQFNYNDKANNVKFKGNIELNSWIQHEEPTSCKEATEEVWSEYLNEAHFSGECLSQPGNVPGSFSVFVEDNGTPGKFGSGDHISIWTNCTPDGSEYTNGGILGAGNIISVGHHD